MASTNPAPPKVFISYSHDSPEHMARVLALSDRLRTEGLDCHIDRYEMFPASGWAQWTWEQIDWAQFVLVVCTEEYTSRLRGKQPAGVGQGARWEGAIITQELYNTTSHNTKFVPVVFSPDDKQHIPTVLAGFTYYQPNTDEGYEGLYRLLTNQPSVGKRALGDIRILPAVQAKAAVPDPPPAPSPPSPNPDPPPPTKKWWEWFRDSLMVPLLIALIGGGGLVTLYKACAPVRARTEVRSDGQLRAIYHEADNSMEFNFILSLKNNGDDSDLIPAANARLENTKLLPTSTNFVPFSVDDIKFSDGGNPVPYPLVIEKGQTRVLNCSLRQRIAGATERVVTTEGKLHLFIYLNAQNDNDYSAEFCFDSGKKTAIYATTKNCH